MSLRAMLRECLVAFLALSFGGCGGSSNSPQDAAVDATPDEGVPPDATILDPVRVHVLLLGQPAEGAHVVFHDFDGLPLADILTDDEGNAEYVMAGGAVTVGVFLQAPVPSMNVNRNRHALRTVLGVKPGDELTFAMPSLAETINDRTAQVYLPTEEVGLTLVRADVGANCSTNGFETPPNPITNPMARHIGVGCFGASNKLGVVAFGQDQSTALTVFSTKKGITPPAPGGSVDVNMDSSWTPWEGNHRTFTLNVTNAPKPGGAGSLNGFHVSDSVVFPAINGTEQNVPAASPQAVSFATSYPEGFAEELHLEFDLVPSWRGAAASQYSMNERLLMPAGDKSETIDLGAQLPPLPYGLTVKLPSNGRPSMEWKLLPGGNAFEAAMYSLTWSAAKATRPDTEGQWTIIGPPPAHSRVVFPSLPESMIEYWPIGVSPREGHIALIHQDLTSDYEALKDMLSGMTGRILPAFGHAYLARARYRLLL